MKSLRSIALGLGLLLATAAANAQGVAVRANIPFDFVAGNQVFPAGEYTLQPAQGDQTALAIRSSDGKSMANVITFGCWNPDLSKDSTLVFHHVGSRYLLSKVQIQGYIEGQQLLPNRAEAEVASNQKAGRVVIFAELVNR